MDINQEGLDRFGQALIQEVRDYAINSIDLIVNGKSGVPFNKELYEKIAAHLGEEQLDIVRYIIPMIVDYVLFDFLVWCEEEDWFDISVKTDSGVLPTLRGAGDGMQGDLFNWIREHSKERYDYLDDRDNFHAQSD